MPRLPRNRIFLFASTVLNKRLQQNGFLLKEEESRKATCNLESLNNLWTITFSSVVLASSKGCRVLLECPVVTLAAQVSPTCGLPERILIGKNGWGFLEPIQLLLDRSHCSPLWDKGPCKLLLSCSWIGCDTLDYVALFSPIQLVRAGTALPWHSNLQWYLVGFIFFGWRRIANGVCRVCHRKDAS